MGRTIAAHTLFWLVLAAVAIVNGILRERTYGVLLSELRAHQLSTFTGMALTGAAAALFARYFPVESETDAIVIGAVWLILTVAFEFVFGHFVAGHSWARLRRDYNLLAGRLWLIFLLWIAALPYAVRRFF